MAPVSSIVRKVVITAVVGVSCIGFRLTQLYQAAFLEWNPSDASFGVPTDCGVRNSSASSLSMSIALSDQQARGGKPDNRINAVYQVNQVNRPSSCRAILQRLHEWNDCWRDHFLRLKHLQPNSTKVLYKKTLYCPVTDSYSFTDDNNNNYNEEDSTSIASSLKLEAVGAPLYHWGFYKGQGFGRAVAHTVEACLTAFVLQRPCLINLTPRDSHYTWRSFVQANSYQWGPTVLHSMPDYYYQINELARALPSAGANDWSKNKKFNLSHFDTDQSLLFPMHKKYPKNQSDLAIQYYHANNTVNPRRSHQILFSPNWANAWFTRIPFAKIYREQYNCDYETLITDMQNAMYGPTDLAQQLQMERFHRAQNSGKWNLTKSSPAVALNTNNNNGQSIPTFKSKSNDDSYGAIHLRMHFINEKREKPIDKGELVTMVRRCLKGAKSLLLKDNDDSDETMEFPENWWLLSDNASMAVEVEKGLRARQLTQRKLAGTGYNKSLFDQATPLINVFHDYSNKTKGAPSKHSNEASVKGKFGHANMAGAIEDWMALYSSKVTIVVHSGSFGTTASRGNGKTPRAYCGRTETDPSQHNQYFQIYF